MYISKKPKVKKTNHLYKNRAIDNLHWKNMLRTENPETKI